MSVTTYFMALDQPDLRAIGTLLDERLKKHTEALMGHFSELQASVDQYLARTEGWNQEFRVLKAQNDRIRQVLIEKGIVTEEELRVLAV